MTAVEVVVGGESGQLWLRNGAVFFVGESGEKRVGLCDACLSWFPYERGRRACSKRCQKLLPRPERRERVRLSPE